jgi:aldose 1-epimerase
LGIDQSSEWLTTLTVKLALANTGHTSFPFGLGLHPFFPRTAATTLDFDVDAVWENDATLLPIILDAASAGDLVAPSHDDLRADVENFGITSLFDGGDLERI